MQIMDFTLILSLAFTTYVPNARACDGQILGIKGYEVKTRSCFMKCNTHVFYQICFKWDLGISV